MKFEWNGHYALGGTSENHKMCVNCGNRLGSHMWENECPEISRGVVQAREELFTAAEAADLEDSESCQRVAFARVADALKNAPQIEDFELVLQKREPSYNSTTKPTNPKDMVGSNKLPLHLWPETATALGCLGLLDGMLKYGRSNYRAIGIRASIYVDAAKRHLNAWFEGEENDPDSGLPHFAHALACIAILVDAQAAGKLNDDRMVKGGYRVLLDSLTPHVARLKALHEGKTPKHYTIEDKVT
jgi:hypothetical protein